MSHLKSLDGLMCSASLGTQKPAARKPLANGFQEGGMVHELCHHRRPVSTRTDQPPPGSPASSALALPFLGGSIIQDPVPTEPLAAHDGHHAMFQ